MASPRSCRDVCASVREGGRGLATVVSGVVTGRLMSCLTTDLAKPDAGRLLYVVVGVFCSVSLSGALVCICGKACLGKALCCLPHPLMNAAVKELASLSLSLEARCSYVPHCPTVSLRDDRYACTVMPGEGQCLSLA